MKFYAAVEVGIAAFCAGQEPPDEDEVLERLAGAGVDRWLAERLVIFLPMAYIRRLVPEVSYQDGLLTPGGRLSLSAEPVFVAALGRAQQAARAELVRIAMYSAEFAAIRELADGGPIPPGMRLTEGRVAWDLPPAEQGDGGVPAPGALSEGILREHGVTLDGETKAGANLLTRPGIEGEQVGSETESSVECGAIQLSRARGGHRDALRRYVVLIDGTEAGRIGRGQTLRFDVPPGAHELQLKIDWCFSQPLTVRVEPGKSVYFSCSHGADAFEALAAVSAGKGGYIALWQTPPPAEKAETATDTIGFKLGRRRRRGAGDR